MRSKLTREGSDLKSITSREDRAQPSGKTDPFEDVAIRPIKPKRAFEEVSDEIKRLIFKGRLQVGDRLPAESKLAERFNVGRQTIREALRYLELSGFIATLKGSGGGIVIVNTVLNAISSSLLDAIQSRRISLHELIVARLELERTVLKHVLLHCDDEDIESLRQNVAEARKKIENGRMAFYENVQFHKILGKASKNYVFVVMMETIMTVMADFLSRRQSNLRLTRRVVIEHEELVKAIASKDESKAFAVLEKHLVDIEKRMQIFQKETGKATI
jgi:DNA-binding FadR family transcriptional regulator